MKKLLTALGAVAVCVLIHAAIPSPQTITFMWDYQATNLTSDMVFKLYTASNPSQPMPWVVIKTIPSPNLSTTLTVVPGQAFYYLTASNFWGESDPSNVAATPALPVSGVLTIRKGP